MNLFYNSILLILLSLSITIQKNSWEKIGSFGKAKLFCVDPFQNIIVYDDETQTLLKLSIKGDTLGGAGGYGWSNYSFDNPTDIYSQNGLDIYVSDYGNHRIVHLNKDFNYISALGNSYPGDEKFIFRYPRSITLDRFGKLYIIDGENNRIVKINEHNKLERSFGGFEAGKGRLIKPTKVRISADDKVVVQDGSRLVVFDLSGNYIKTIGDHSFKDLHSFAIQKDVIYALDKLNLIRIKSYGKIAGVVPQKSIADNLDFINIDIINDFIYFLTDKFVIRVEENSLPMASDQK